MLLINIIIIITKPFLDAQAGLGPTGDRVKVGENIIQNPGFEDNSDGAPVLWDLKGIGDGVICKVSSSQVLSGTRSLELSSNKLTDSMVTQKANVKPDVYYRVMFNVLPESIKNQFGAPHILLYYGSSARESTKKYSSTEMKDTEGHWSNIGFYIKTLKGTNEPLYIALELGGGMGGKNAGTVYFDDISMQPVENPEVLQKFETVVFNATGIMEPPK